MSWDDRELEQLLSNGYLSGRQYDEIEARVLHHVASPGRTPPSPRLAAAAYAGSRWVLSQTASATRILAGVRAHAAASAAVVAMLLVWLAVGDAPETDTSQIMVAPGAHTNNGDTGGFVAKGVGSERHWAGVRGVLDFGCNQLDSHSCQRGDTLMFSINAAVASGYLGAYAERVDDPSATRIWYFPREDGTAPWVGPGNGTLVLPQGVEVGASHVPGRYRITLWLSRTPIVRGSALEAKPGRVLAMDTLAMVVQP